MCSGFQVPVWRVHRALKSDSNKRFCTRGFAFGAFILGHGESKKSCLNYCRNRSSNHLPSRGSNPGPLREQLLDKNFSSRLYIIDFRETCLKQHLKYFIVRAFLAYNIPCKSSSFKIKI